MKKIIIITITLLAALSTASAQPQSKGGATPPYHTTARGEGKGDFKAFQMKLIVRQLQIQDKETEAAFEELYTEYAKAMNEMRPKRINRECKRLTDEQIESQILESFTLADKTTQLRKTYYFRFKEILSPHQILEMYKTERRINERIASEIENRSNGKPHKNRGTKQPL